MTSDFPTGKSGRPSFTYLLQLILTLENLLQLTQMIPENVLPFIQDFIKLEDNTHVMVNYLDRLKEFLLS